jgi:electron transport complex protein RnfB
MREPDAERPTHEPADRRRDAGGATDINRCPPGGEAGIRSLATLLGVEYRPLDPACGAEQPRAAAFIREELCIGCTLCIQACPVDAIVGAPKRMHTVLIEACTGCELCVPPCPVDCIDMLALHELAGRGCLGAAGEAATPVAAHALRWRSRYAAHLLRTSSDGDPARTAAADHDLDAGRHHKHAAIDAALARARARRAGAT